MKTELKNRLELTRNLKSYIRTGYAWPGGYPMAIVFDDGGAVCMTCARNEWKSIAHDTIKDWKGTGWNAVGMQVLWEGGNHCDHCNECLDAYPAEDEPDSIADELLNALRNVTHPMAGDDELQDALAVIAKAEGREA